MAQRPASISVYSEARRHRNGVMHRRDIATVSSALTLCLQAHTLILMRRDLRELSIAPKTMASEWIAGGVSLRAKITQCVKPRRGESDDVILESDAQAFRP